LATATAAPCRSASLHWLSTGCASGALSGGRVVVVPPLPALAVLPEPAPGGLAAPLVAPEPEALAPPPVAPEADVLHALGWSGSQLPVGPAKVAPAPGGLDDPGEVSAGAAPGEHATRATTAQTDQRTANPMRDLA
jgi:hypothetical protein